MSLKILLLALLAFLKLCADACVCVCVVADADWAAGSARGRQFAKLKKDAEGHGPQKNFGYGVSTGML